MSGAVLFLKRARMASTHGFVAGARVCIDFANSVFLYVTGPVRRKWTQLVGDAPWVGVIAGSMVVQFGPQTLVPAIGPYVTPDTRRVLEAERVRQEIQAGNDPYPYLIDREKTYGAKTHNQETRMELYPREAVPENQSIDALRARRNRQFERDMAALDHKISALETAAGANDDRFTEWIRSGVKQAPGAVI
uniref:Uncharacterized protein n=1 Tax=Neobodo designis TaxID=312471 RepID=A0A7S1PYZ5_NEODS|mmetsp:Transcript_24906/g.76975  ORF Transcript_24906/g.76975 Transcript_24906/m.76975 type:complete len:191 (+) Transcript_24906:104-676(+)|eukprot:CAMPEP_0174841302 /NCGR_PEP_ID=MMETSP1114-20130205/9226_1 /TAXON_ID=312471 /ORGANISM="Neobodo designis, Strain CCAP 1951/1" /LENGTH=190 /DNA_ID=CAMNT_0016075483 /DNA_START=104 /DNA_END=676 /DNA_ORIENTATION=-